MNLPPVWMLAELEQRAREKAFEACLEYAYVWAEGPAPVAAAERGCYEIREPDVREAYYVL